MPFQYRKLADSLYEQSSEQLLFSDEDALQDQTGKGSELIRTQRMVFQWNRAHCTTHHCVAPVFDRFPVYKSEVHDNFTIYWPGDKPSIFQQPPSPEVDEAWDRISSTESIALSAEEVRRIGYDPAATWPAPESDFGEDVYYGVLDVFHQLHCLNNLRKTTWPEYYGDMRKKMIHTPINWDHHLTHCTYVLMRSITCHADLEVLVGQKFAGWPGLNLNFGSTKMCRNFDEILKWKEDHTIRQTGPWTEYPDRPIIEQSPEGILTPYGNHLGIEDWAESQGISLAIPSGLEWQPNKSHGSEKAQVQQ
ncbi:hypothetical protein EIK77_001514 [Talaromyces pinophilus]|nr:hypothetical protein EIK77_001514 [Talaromyces pinophilus]